ncbi:MAG: IPT/TIG domain-containing protein [Thermoanaerobaculaceae bacterium]|nr:IPT/TIG domain-containing protein [Thermoanaerobaculaceae bacterium]
MKQRTLIVALVLGLAGVLAGCSADSPTAPKPSPTPTAYSITLESSASSAEVGAAILLTARVTQGGGNAADNTSVTFSFYSCPGAGVISDPSFENGMCQIIRTTTSGAATATVVSRTEGTYSVSALVRGQTLSKNLRFFNPVNPRSLAIYGVVPDEGSPEGGERVTIHGRGFAQPLAVTFKVANVDRSAQVAEVNAAGTQMVVITPKAPLEGDVSAAADITVVAGVGTESEVEETAEKIFTYTRPFTPGAPAIYSIVPSEGLDKGGEQVTIYGANFYSPTVKLGDENAQVVSTSSDHSSLLLLTPKHSRPAGSTQKEYVDVVVTTNAGGVTRTNGWAWLPPVTEPLAPVLYSVNPNRGSPRGGQEVTLLGANLCNAYDTITKKCVAAPAVRFDVDGFGERTATVLSYAQDGSSLVVITPSISPNPVLTDANASITVTNPQGSATLTNLYTFVGEAGDPQILGISPNKGSARGGDTVTIYGKYFLAPVQVQFSLGGLAVVEEVSADKTAITVKVPAASIQPLDADTFSNVTVTTQAGTGRDRSATLTNGYLFLADEPTPELFALSPNSGPVDGGTRVTITGQGFQYPVQVYFGDRQAQVISNNFNQVICVTPSITPSQPGTPTNVEVTVLNTTTGKRSNAVTFRYGEAMFLSAISPNRGPADEETTVTIYGQGFVGPVEVVTEAGQERIQANVLSVSGTEIIAKIRPLPDNRRACGIVAAEVTVTNLNSNISASGVTFYYESPAPLITAVEITAPTKTGNDNTVPQYNPGSSYGSCSTNSNWGNYKVTVRGSNFQKTATGSSAMVISIPGVTAELPTTYVSANELWFMLPDLTGVGMQEISCIAGTGTCGLVFVQTPVALTVKNLRSNCSDTLGGAIVIVPCDQRCREVPAISAITIAVPPVGDPNVVQGFTVGVPFDVTVTLTSAPQAGTNVVVRLSYVGFDAAPTEVTVPGGLGSAAFLFSVTPTVAGAGTIIAQTGTGPCTRVAQTTPPIIVRAALTITTTSPLAAGTVGVAYSQTLAASGGSGGYNWTLVSDAGSGLSLSAGGVLSGTPAAASTYVLTVRVKDSENRSVEKPLSVTIAAAAP